MRSCPIFLLVALWATTSLAKAAAGSDPVQAVLEQNARLQEEVKAQQKMIEELTAKIAGLGAASERQERELRRLADRSEGPAAPDRTHEVRVSAEAGMAFFQTGKSGQFPKAEFRVDDPLIAIEAPVAKQVYFYGEMKLLTRETGVEGFQLGELYVDFEDVAARWGHPGLLSFRAGRINIPFGEEYQWRTPVANSLISHSLSDVWGSDEGLEVYGRLGPVHYVLAVQNGGLSQLHDFNPDKAVTGRLSWDPQPWLHLSASAERTGELTTAGDGLSETWFANGFFQALGPAERTKLFWADLFEADATARWKEGHVSAAFGEARFNDSNPLAADARRMHYGYLELVQPLAGRLYGAARYSAISAPGGYPLAGWGNSGEYAFSSLRTERLERLSVGAGYRFADPLVIKFEYTWEKGRLVGGGDRNHEDFFGSEIGFKF